MREPRPSNLITQYLLYWIPFFAGLLVYLSTLSFGFVQDDLIHITNNPLVTSGGDSIEIFRQGIFPGTLYRPILILSYRLTHDFFGSDPFWYHAGNILLHAGICVLVTLVLSRVFAFRDALIAGVLFALQPIHIEAVANVSGRSELLTHFFGLLMLYVATRKAPDSVFQMFTNVLMVFSLCILSFLSKESGLVYIPLLLLIWWYQTDSRAVAFLRERASLLAAALFAAVLALLLRANALSELAPRIDTTAQIDNPLLPLGHIDRAMNGFILLGKYLYLSFASGDLVKDYSFDEQQVYHTLLDSEVVAYLPLVFLFLLLAFQGIKRKEPAGFCGLFFFLSFLITSNIFFPIGTIFAERLAYLPSVAIAGMLAIYLSVIKRASLRGLFIVMLVVAFSAQTIGYSQFWANSAELYERQYRIGSRSVKALVNYGIVLRNTGKLKESRKLLSQARLIAPNYAEADFALATLEFSTGNKRAAKDWLLSAIEKNPAHLPALNMMARLLFNQGNFMQAEIFFRRALKVSPGDSEALLGAFALHLKRGNLKEASVIHRKLRRLIPNSPEFLQLDAIYSKILKQRTRSSHPIET